MRDAITLFEQYAVGGVLKKKYIEENLELIGEDFLSLFVESLVQKDAHKTLENLAFLREKSLDVRLFLEQLLFFLRDRMKDSLKTVSFVSYAELFQVFEGIYGRLKFSPDPFLLLETSVFRCISAHITTPVSVVSEKKLETLSTPPPRKTETISEKTPPLVASPEDISSPVSDATKHTSTETPTTPFDFAQFIEHIRTVPKRSFVGLGLRVSTYSQDGNLIVIHPDNDFNLKKLDSQEVRLFLQETLDSLF